MEGLQLFSALHMNNVIVNILYRKKLPSPPLSLCDHVRSREEKTYIAIFFSAANPEPSFPHIIYADFFMNILFGKLKY